MGSGNTPSCDSCNKMTIQSSKKNKDFTWFDSVPTSTATTTQIFNIIEIGLRRKVFIITMNMTKL